MTDDSLAHALRRIRDQQLFCDYAINSYGDACRKWSIVWRRHFEMQCSAWKSLYFDLNFTAVCFHVSVWQYIITGSGNGLSPDRRQAVNRTNANPFPWRHMCIPMPWWVQCNTPGTRLPTWINFNAAWISDCIRYEIIYLFSNFNGAAVEISEWISNFYRILYWTHD